MTSLSPGKRQLIARFADTLVPATAAMPAASELDLAAAPLDRVLGYRPDLVIHLEALPDLPAGLDCAAYLNALQQEHLPLFDALLQAVLGAYTIHPEVKRRLGYQGQQALSLPKGGFGGEDLLEAMMARPPSFRVPPAD